MGVRHVQMSFAGGEVSPSLYGRFDDAKYQTGLAQCRNFIVQPQGPATLRPGTAYVNSTKYSDRPARLIPFTFSTEQTMALEFGDKYVRFHTAGKTLLGEDGLPYEVETPYEADDVFDIHYVQSMDVMTLVHPNYAPRELRRYGATDWRLESVNFSAPLEPPTISSVEYKVVAGDGVTITNEEKTRYTLKYKVTCVRELDTGDQESEASEMKSCLGNLYLNNADVTIKWNAVDGADRYRVYKNYKGLYCYIGETEETEFVDDNYEPDAGITPPIYDDPFFTSKGIQSVTVENGGSGYVWSEKGIADWDSSVIFTNIYTSGTGGEGSKTASPWCSAAARGDDGGMSVGWDSSEVYVYDAAGGGSGAQVELVNSVTSGVSTHSFSSGDGTDSFKYSWARCTFQKFTVKNRGKNYVKPMLRVCGPWYSLRNGSLSGHSHKRWEAPLTVIDGGVELEVQDATGWGALLQPVIQDGAIVSVRVIRPGQGYTNPTIVIKSKYGSGAVLKANIGASGDYPGAVCYYEQRRCFAGTPTRPQMVWMSRSGTESDMSYTLPSQDDNRLRFEIAAQEASRILHLTPLAQILALTNSTEYRVSSGGSAPMSPDAIRSEVQSQIGASNVQPLVVNSTLLYASARGGHVRELGYNWQSSGYTTGDLSIRAAHFFESARVVDMTLAKSPDSIAWFAMSDGSMLGLTYLPEQAVGGWHKHTTINGAIESVVSVPEGDEDALYMVVRRTINGQNVRYIERMHERYFSELENAWHVDCGGEYIGEETTEISGLTWLEGETVSIFADGCVLPQRVVTDGKISLTKPSVHVIVGLPITADLQTLPVAVDLGDGSYGTGHSKNVNDVWLRLHKSSGVFVGPDFENLTEVKQRTTEPYGLPPNLLEGEVSVAARSQWNNLGQICVRQSDPLPLTIISAAWELAA